MPSPEAITWLQGTLPEAVVAAFEVVTYLGSAPVYGVVAGVVALAWDRRSGYVLAAALLASAAVNAALKEALAWPRPPARLHRVAAGGFGFPSGHAQNNAVFWATLGRLRPTRRMWAAGVAAVVLVSLSRVVLGVHFVRDVAAGVAVGLAVAGAVWLGERGVDRWSLDADAAGQLLVAVLAPLPAAFAGAGGYLPAASGAVAGFGAAFVVEGEVFGDRPTGLLPLAAGGLAGGAVLLPLLFLPGGPASDWLRAFAVAAAAVLAAPLAVRRRRAGAG